MSKFIRWFEEISIKDVPLVGGKNASLGEMFQIRTLVRSTGIPEEVASEIREAYAQLCLRSGVQELDVPQRGQL
jgi:pyruvate,water dikinase